MSRLSADLTLLLAAAIWGAGFVAQSSAMRSLDPLWFVALRFMLSAVAVAPAALIEARGTGTWLPRSGWRWVAGVSVCLLIGATLQQFGLQFTSVTNAGFLTGLYVLVTPILGLVMFREFPGISVWPAALLALAGTWMLGGGIAGLNWGDLLVIACAAFWAGQMVFMGRAVRLTGRPLLVSMVQYLVTGIGAGLLAVATVPLTLSAIEGCWTEIVYAGLFSGAIGFSLQAVAQRYTGTAEAAILLAAEAPFAGIFGAAFLGERLTGERLAGCALIFAAIVLVQIWPNRRSHLSFSK